MKLPRKLVFRFSDICRAAERSLFVIVLWQLGGGVWSLLSAPVTSSNLRFPQAFSSEKKTSLEALLRWYGPESVGSMAPVDDYSLIAVIAGKEGAALLKDKTGASVAVRVGQEIGPGNRLVSVEATQVLINQSGQTRALRLPRAESDATSAITPAATISQQETRLPAIRLSRREATSGWRRGSEKSWSDGVSLASDGGIRIDNVQQAIFARILRLKEGDLLMSINQRPLKALADISQFSHFFGHAHSVDLTLIRQGVSQIQHYEIKP